MKQRLLCQQPKDFRSIVSEFIQLSLLCLLSNRGGEKFHVQLKFLMKKRNSNVFNDKIFMLVFQLM